MSTLNGKTICRSLKLLNPTVRVYSNLWRNMGRKPGDETFKKSGIGQAQYLYSLSRRPKLRYLHEEKNNEGLLQKTCLYSRAQNENFGELIAADHKVPQWQLRISKQSPIRCRGTRFGNSMDPIISAQNKNFTWNRKKLAKVRGADAETQSPLRWQFPRTWQSLRRFILESLSVNTSPSRDEQDCWKSGTSAALLLSGLDEKWRADFMECFCYLRCNSRSLVWWEDTLRKAIRRTKQRTNNPIWFADWIWSYFCHRPVATESPTRRTSGICLVCKENLEGRNYVRRHWGIGKDGRIWNSCKKVRREESDYAQNWWFPSAIEKKVKLLGGDQVLRTSTLMRDNPERGEVHEDLRGESDGSPPPTRQDSTHGDGSHCNQCSLLRTVFRIVCRNADIYLRGNLLFHDLINQVMLRSLQHGIVIFGIINAFVYDHNFHRHNVYQSSQVRGLHGGEDSPCDCHYASIRPCVPRHMLHRTLLWTQKRCEHFKVWAIFTDGGTHTEDGETMAGWGVVVRTPAGVHYAMCDPVTWSSPCVRRRQTHTNSRVSLKHSPSWDLLDPSLVECRFASFFLDSRHAANICMGSIQSRANVQLGLMSQKLEVKIQLRLKNTRQYSYSHGQNVGTESVDHAAAIGARGFISNQNLDTRWMRSSFDSICTFWSMQQSWRNTGHLSWNQRACKYSQLHMSAEHDHEHECNEHMMSRLQAHQQPHTKKGWRFATESPWTLWHIGGSRRSLHREDDHKRPQDTDKSQDKPAFSETRCWHTLGNLQSAYRFNSNAGQKTAWWSHPCFELLLGVCLLCRVH